MSDYPKWLLDLYANAERTPDKTIRARIATFRKQHAFDPAITAAVDKLVDRLNFLYPSGRHTAQQILEIARVREACDELIAAHDANILARKPMQNHLRPRGPRALILD